MRKRKNPLIKRIPRELRGDWKKYALISLFLILTIGFISGMYVANGSMLQAAEEGISKYKREDGRFQLSEQAGEGFMEALEKESGIPVKIYENFYRDESEDYNGDGVEDGTVRVYAKTDEINEACLMDGRFPEAKDEIAIDRMHADNVGAAVGDTMEISGRSFQVVGLIAYVNYATLHEKTTDFMFDALKFDVAMVTEEGFESLKKSVHYTYAWQYEDKPEDEKEEKSFSDDFLETLLTQTAASGNTLTEYVPAYANPAIYFAVEDMGSDKAMGGVLLDILIVIIAFIFAVTTSDTMVKEAPAIGELRASGYTRREVIFHYLAVPVIVTFLSAAAGNILGYSLFKNVVVSMYYNSYSLPAYQTVWNGDAFFKTTWIPVLLMLAVNLIMTVKMMRYTPLQFLRRDLKKKKRKKAMRLPGWSFFGRFRLRIIFQNLPDYGILFAGIFFIMVLLAMAVGMPDTLRIYKENASDMMFANYQYVLKACVDEEGNLIETSDPSAEKFSLYSLEKRGEALTEEVSVYGISRDSRYVEIEELSQLSEEEVYISAAFGEKYGLKAGDTVFLDEKYENKAHRFKVAGVYEKCQSIAVFMPIENYCAVFDQPKETFSGYLSDSKITDIPEERLATVLTERDITKMCDQLDHSMGSYMKYFQVLCVLLSAVLIYLLTKLIIEKNQNAISMVKILGYKNGEIARLYLLSTTILVVLFAAVSSVLGGMAMKLLWEKIMQEYTGWLAFVMEPLSYVKIFVFVLAGYALVAFFDFRRIRKIPMDRAIRNVE